MTSTETHVGKLFLCYDLIFFISELFIDQIIFIICIIEGLRINSKVMNQPSSMLNIKIKLSSLLFVIKSLFLKDWAVYHL